MLLRRLSVISSVRSIRLLSTLPIVEGDVQDDMIVYKKKSEAKKEYTVVDSINQVKALIHREGKTKPAKYIETVELAVQLAIDTRKQGQALRGTIGLPHGTGKRPVIVCFAVGEKADEALKAGADIVGGEELVKKILEEKNLVADRTFATPDMMPLVGRIARILGPRGLMPNPKLGTMTKDVGEAIRTALQGSVTFKAETAGVVHIPIGNVGFKVEELKENFQAAMIHLSNIKPNEIKGKYIKSVCMSSTQGKGYKLAIKYADPSSSFFMREDV